MNIYIYIFRFCPFCIVIKYMYNLFIPFVVYIYICIYMYICNLYCLTLTMQRFEARGRHRERFRCRFRIKRVILVDRMLDIHPKKSKRFKSVCSVRNMKLAKEAPLFINKLMIFFPIILLSSIKFFV